MSRLRKEFKAWVRSRGQGKVPWVLDPEYRAARREYAFHLVTTGLTYKAIGLRLGVSGMRAKWIAYEHVRHGLGLDYWGAEAFLRNVKAQDGTG